MVKHRDSLNRNGGGQGGGGEPTTQREQGTVEEQDWTIDTVQTTETVADGEHRGFMATQIVRALSLSRCRSS